MPSESVHINTYKTKMDKIMGKNKDESGQFYIALIPEVSYLML